MENTNYILTLDFIKKQCEEVGSQWNGDEPGREEEQAAAAVEILQCIKQIERLLPEIIN